MTAPLTPAQLDGIRADLRYLSRVRSMLPSRRARVAIALSEADTARTLLAEVDRLRDYADTIDGVNADLTRANEVHRQRIRDVLAEKGMRAVVLDHFCTPECPDGCDIAKTRQWVGEVEVIQRRKPLDPDELAALHEQIARIRRAAGVES